MFDSSSRLAADTIAPETETPAFGRLKRRN
jgi:hypothetical protein